jgi:hypothetical protein
LRQIDEEQLQLDRAYAIHMASMVESNRFIHCNLDVSNHILHLILLFRAILLPRHLI